MEDHEIKRLRREISRTFGSSPHKRKYWLALLEMHLQTEKTGNAGGCKTVRESDGRR
jgi:hypothetical protein